MSGLAFAAGGLSLVQGLFGRSDASKARKEAERVQEENRRAVAQANRTNEALGQKVVDLGNEYRHAPMVKMGELVAASEAAGFNPLTVLRAGGLSAYSKVNDSAAFQMMQSGYSMQSPQVFQGSPLPTVPGFGTVLAGAASDAFGHYMTDVRTAQHQAFQRDLLGMTLTARKPGAKGGNAASGGKQYATYAAPTGVVSGGFMSGLPYAATAGDKTVTNPYFGWRTDPTNADAEAYEARQGEIGGEVQGLFNQANDFWFNVTGKTRQERWEQTKGWLGSFIKISKDPALGAGSWYPSVTVR